MLVGAVKDNPSSSPDWDLRAPKIDGLVLREVKNISTRHGHTVELWREDWGLHDREIVHIISVTLTTGAISAWHCHKKQTDHIFVTKGAMQVACFDAREDSPTKNALDVYNLSVVRPTLIVIPPGVFHGIKNTGDGSLVFNNFFDVAYNYSDPDEYRLPYDNDVIDYRFP